MTATQDTGELPVVTPVVAPVVAPGSDTDGPLVPSPTEGPAWFVSLVPPRDSLPLEFDPLRSGPSSAPPHAPAKTAPGAPAAAAELPVRLVVPEPRTEAPVVVGTAPVARPRTPLDRVRGTWRQGLPTSLAVLLVALLLVPGVLLDVARDGSFGLPSTVLFVVAAVGTPLVLRPRSLASGVVLPPLAFASTAAAIAWRSGLNDGTRQIGLDAGTTMALHAPLVFAGTAAALLVVLTRVTIRLVRR